MLKPFSLLALALAVTPTAQAEVKELDGEELVDAYVQGISIGQEITDKAFAKDDESMREITDDQRNALGAVGVEVAVSNAEALNRDTTRFNDRLSAIEDGEVRDLVEDAITETSLSTRLDMNIDRVAADTGVPVAAGNPQDFTVLRGTVLELLPSTTGYQLEFFKDRF